MQPSFGSYDEGYGADLLCPQCGSHNLHHEKVEVFECGEDAKHGVHIIVAEGKAEMDTSLTGNPSRRRHGLNIHFWCENCSAKSILSISQHKGSTLVDLNNVVAANAEA